MAVMMRCVFCSGWKHCHVNSAEKCQGIRDDLNLVRSSGVRYSNRLFLAYLSYSVMYIARVPRYVPLTYSSVCLCLSACHYFHICMCRASDQPQVGRLEPGMHPLQLRLRHHAVRTHQTGEIGGRLMLPPLCCGPPPPSPVAAAVDPSVWSYVKHTVMYDFCDVFDKYMYRHIHCITGLERYAIKRVQQFELIICVTCVHTVQCVLQTVGLISILCHRRVFTLFTSLQFALYSYV